MAFNLITPVSDVLRRDFPINTGTLSTDPTASANAKNVAGAWVSLEESSGVQQLSTCAGATDKPCYPVWTQKGDTAAQAIDKLTIIMSHGWEAETSMYAGSPVVGDLLTHNSDGKLLVTTTAGNIVIGVCTRGVSNSKIRFQSVSPYTHN